MTTWMIERQLQDAVRAAIRLRARAALLSVAGGSVAVAGLFCAVLVYAGTETTVFRVVATIPLLLAAAAGLATRRARKRAEEQDRVVEELVSDLTFALGETEPRREVRSAMAALEHQRHSMPPVRVDCQRGELR
jgi:hypothetical protein